MLMSSSHGLLAFVFLAMSVSLCPQKYLSCAAVFSQTTCQTTRFA